MRKTESFHYTQATAMADLVAHTQVEAAAAVAAQYERQISFE